MSVRSLQTLLTDGIVLTDGAMGTYFHQLTGRPAAACEPANLTDPALIRKIHHAYLTAGARFLRTNTYANTRAALQMNAVGQRRILTAAWENAQAAVAQFKQETQIEEPIIIAADLGCLAEFEKNRPAEELEELVEFWVDLGARHFVFETLTGDSVIKRAAAMVRRLAPATEIVATFAVEPEGFTRTGIPLRTLFETFDQLDDVDVIGLNCVSGPLHMLRLIQSVRLPRKPLAVLPNAGYPTVINREIYYPDTPDYFAGQMQQIVAAGARLIGGCCGTTPEFIRAVADLLKRSDRRPADVRIAAGEPVSPDTPAERRVRAEATNPLLRQFAAGKTVIAVEYDSPETAADLSNYLENALSIEEAGADAITIADCPVARPRIDSSLTAIRLRHTLRTAVPVPHLTCRDRNLNATKALLLGLNAEEVLNLIIVTGDPIPRAERDEVKSVFNFNSINLAAFIMSLNEDTFAVPMTVAGAFNINALSFDAELRKTRRKIKAGMKILYTQPVLSEAAVERMAQLRESLPEEIKIMGGILPVVSHRNALYMQNELSGIVLDPDVIDRYEGLNREQGEALALDISVRVAERIRNTVSGFYLITPFNRVKLVNRILAEIKKL